MFLEYVSHPIGLLASIVLLFKLFIKKTKAMKSNNFAATIIKAVLPVFALLLSTQLFAQVVFQNQFSFQSKSGDQLAYFKIFLHRSGQI